MQVPVVTVYKNGRSVDVDLWDVARWVADGWSKEQAAPVAEPVFTAVEAAPVQLNIRASRKVKQ